MYVSGGDKKQVGKIGPQVVRSLLIQYGSPKLAPFGIILYLITAPVLILISKAILGQFCKRTTLVVNLVLVQLYQYCRI